MATSKSTARVSVAAEAKARLTLCIEADGSNRSAAIDDLKFAAGDQWPAAIKLQRQLDRRPCLTINKTDTFVRSVVNNMRQQRPRIRVHPVSDGADQAIAEVIQGLIRHIEVASNADAAYDTACDYQVRMGWGFFRIYGKYADDNAWDQDLYIERIRNPFSVYFDPSSITPDGSDAKWCVITAPMKKVEFEKKYPGKKVADFTGMGDGDSLGQWAKKDEVMVAEYWRVEEKAEVLCRLNTGKSMFVSDLPDEDEMKQRGWIVIDRRDSIKRVVKWSKISATEELETRDWRGKYIPVIPVYGAELLDSGAVIRYGMVRQLKDPQAMYNFWRTQETEFVALAPKAPWLMAEGQDEGHEDEWDSANVKNYSSLKYKPVTDDNGQTLPPPQRQQPQAVPAASVNAAMAASEDLKAVAGMFDPSLGAAGQETSGTMVRQRQQQSDLSNYHFYDNFTRSLRHAGLILLDLIPYYYDTERVIRIIGEDGNPESTTINQQAVDKVLNDLTIGRYDVVMDTGPGYDTKRQEASETMMQMLAAMPELAKIAGDMIVRQMDWPGANDLADRIAMTIPAASIAKELPKDLDPKAKQMLAQLMGQNQQLTQQVQQLTQEKQAKVFGVQEREQAITERERELRKMAEDAELHRLHVKELGQDERLEKDLTARIHMRQQQDTTSLHETVIDATTNLQIAHKQALQRGAPNANRTTD